MGPNRIVGRLFYPKRRQTCRGRNEDQVRYCSKGLINKTETKTQFYEVHCGLPCPVALSRPSPPIRRELLGVKFIQTSFLVGIGVNLDPFLYPEQR